MTDTVNDQDPLRHRTRNRLILIGIMLLTLLPLGAAVWLYYGAPGLVEGATTNSGALLDPPAQLAELELRDELGSPVTAGERRIWRLLLVPALDADGGCGEACLEHSWLLRHTQVLLGRDDDRVLRLMVVPAARRAEVADQFADIDPTLEVVSGPADLIPTLLGSRALRGGEAPARPDAGVTTGVVVVDPLGNVIFYFALEQINTDLFGDLKRLLRLSNIG